MSEKSSRMIESPIAIPPEAGLEVGRPRPISHQDGLQVDWEAQMRYEAAMMQREIVAELEGNRQFLRQYRKILGVSVLWFWVILVVLVCLLAAGIGGGIAGGMKNKNKNNNNNHESKWADFTSRTQPQLTCGSRHNHTQTTSGLSNVTWPCQTDPYSNNTIVDAALGKDMPSINFLLLCNRTFDVGSRKLLERHAIPDTVANMGGCMEACLDYTAASGTYGSSKDSDDICYAVTVNKNETDGQKWCNIFSGSGWGTDQVGADCAVNLSTPSPPSSTASTIEKSAMVVSVSFPVTSSTSTIVPSRYSSSQGSLPHEVFPSTKLYTTTQTLITVASLAPVVPLS